MNFNIRNILVIFVISIGLNACGTGRATCFNDEMRNAALIWGTYDSKTQTYTGNHLAPSGKFSGYFRDSLGKETMTEKGSLKDKETCRILALFYWSMKTVQVCNEPGDKLRFMRFRNDETNTFWNVMWNEKFNSGSNRNLKMAQDSIDILIKTIETK